jgi:alkylation response protein AidB-like acyl-CoA dehydrogenase
MRIKQVYRRSGTAQAEVAPDTLPVLDPGEAPSEEFGDFLNRYRRTLRELFVDTAANREIFLRRGLSVEVLRAIRTCKPLSVVIPEQYGGRGNRVHEFLAVLAASSYESLPLSLIMGINGGLFLQPVAKYGSAPIKAPIFRQFMEHDAMGGLMITEPEHGTDALRMQTSATEYPDHYHLRGTKHWAGLTGTADFWLVTARRQDPSGKLGRDIEFFVCDVSQEEQRIEVEEYYRNLGLHIISYGRNRIDAQVPKEQRLEPESTGVKMMLDLLHRSRAHFPGMGMGFLKRMLDEAVTHCKTRHVGGRSLFQYDQVKDRLARLQAAYTACSAMCAYSSEYASIDNDLYGSGVQANSAKAVVTDLMHEAAQSLMQLVGATGYRLDHIAGRALVDSRPFQIFEGSNDVLYHQVSDSVLKSMRRLKQTNLYDYLSTSDLTQRASGYFQDLFDFEVDLDMPQRKLVELGKILGRVVSMEFTIELGERGFRNDLVANTLSVLRQDVESTLASYRNRSIPTVVEDYVVGSSWLNYLRPQT